MGLQVLTACRLIDSRVVYLAHDGNWSEWIEEGETASSEAESEALKARGAAGEEANVVFETYLVDVVDDGGTLKPVSLREFIRANGPTIHPNFGLQAERRKKGDNQAITRRNAATARKVASE